MAEPRNFGNKISGIISSALNEFEVATSGTSEKALRSITRLSNGLDLDMRGNIKASTKNLKIIKQIENEINKIFVSAGYQKSVEEFLKSFEDLATAQDFRTNKITGDKLSKSQSNFITTTAQTNTIDALVKSGMQNNLVGPVVNILNQNVGGAGNYTDMLNNLRDFIVTDPQTPGRFERYVSQIATDALNQYNANYTQAIANDLGFDWFYYSGPIKDTTRQFCCDHAQKYWHISEVKKMGRTPSLWNKKPGSKCKGGGRIDGTNETTIFIYRGGYRCNHQFIPVPEGRVPASARSRIAL